MMTTQEMILALSNLSTQQLARLKDSIDGQLKQRKSQQAREWVNKMQALIDECPFEVLGCNEWGGESELRPTFIPDSEVIFFEALD